MIPIEKLRAVQHVISHANCSDGISSALIVKDALPDVRVSFMQYDTEEHRNLEPAPGLLFVDFTPVERLLEFSDAGALVLDHHPTARDIVEAFGENGVFGENDLGESGAWLAYEQVWVPLKQETLVKMQNEHPSDINANTPLAAFNRTQAVERFARLAAIRDTWKKGNPQWQEACEQASLLLFWPVEDERPLEHYLVDGAGIGNTLYNKQLDHARKSIEESHRFMTERGTRVLMFQGTSATSDAAEMLDVPHYFDSPLDEEGKTNCRWCGALNTRPFEVAEKCRSPEIVVGFHYRSEAGKLQLQFSMRSHTGYDVSALARHYGGGGHAAAAGFTVDVLAGDPNPFTHALLLIEDYEGGR